MNIVERIQNEYPPNWFVMDDGPARLVKLDYEPSVPQPLQERLNEVLHDRFALRFSPDAELCLTLQKDDKKQCCYQLLQDGQLLYRFSEQLPLASAAYSDHVEAISWVVYFLSTTAEKNWLEQFRGSYITCRLLCAQQQRIAAEYRAFAQNQYAGGHYTDTHYTKQCEKLSKPCQKFVDEIPCPSCQPIRKEGFKALKKSVFCIQTKKTLPAEEFYRMLFGDADFLQTINLYCEYIKTTEDYRISLEKAKKQLTEDVLKVPIAAANGYLSGLHHFITNLAAEEPDAIKCDPISIARNYKHLRNALTPFDNAWKTYAAHRIKKEFLLQVQQAVVAQMGEELRRANRVVQDARISLNRFSVLDAGKGDNLRWQHLAQPETADIYVPETVWNHESFSALQRTITDNDVWLCSRNLLEEMKQKNSFAQGMDRTYGVQLSTNQYVWVFWRTNA